MSPEGFSHNYDQRPPEVTGNAGTRQPAKQLTLGNLLKVISDKSKAGIGQPGRRSVHLHTPNDVTGVATVWQMSRGTNLERPDCVGQINHIKGVGDSGDQTATNYFISETPDGLEIEKTSKTYKARRDFGYFLFRPQDKASFASEGLRRIAESRDHEGRKAEPNQSFTSEQETRSLITLLVPLVPAELTQRSYRLWSKGGQ